eukprot:14812501-Alexandrium_andersonii.AAC.1
MLSAPTGSSSASPLRQGSRRATHRPCIIRIVCGMFASSSRRISTFGISAQTGANMCRSRAPMTTLRVVMIHVGARSGTNNADPRLKQARAIAVLPLFEEAILFLRVGAVLVVGGRGILSAGLPEGIALQPAVRHRTCTI